MGAALAVPLCCQTCAAGFEDDAVEKVVCDDGYSAAGGCEPSCFDSSPLCAPPQSKVQDRYCDATVRTEVKNKYPRESQDSALRKAPPPASPGTVFPTLLSPSFGTPTRLSLEARCAEPPPLVPAPSPFAPGACSMAAAGLAHCCTPPPAPRTLQPGPLRLASPLPSGSPPGVEMSFAVATKVPPFPKREGLDDPLSGTAFQRKARQQDSPQMLTPEKQSPPPRRPPQESPAQRCPQEAQHSPQLFGGTCKGKSVDSMPAPAGHCASGIVAGLDAAGYGVRTDPVTGKLFYRPPTVDNALPLSPGVERIDPIEAHALLQQADVTLVDVRTQDRQAGLIAGAVHEPAIAKEPFATRVVPLAQRLAAEKLVIFTCQYSAHRAPFSANFYRQMAPPTQRVAVLNGGFRGWQACRLPVQALGTEAEGQTADEVALQLGSQVLPPGLSDAPALRNAPETSLFGAPDLTLLARRLAAQ